MADINFDSLQQDKVVNLSSRELTNEKLIQLLSSLEQSSQLEKLDLNHIIFQPASILINFLTKMINKPHLKSVNVEGCFSKESLESLKENPHAYEIAANLVSLDNSQKIIFDSLTKSAIAEMRVKHPRIKKLFDDVIPPMQSSTYQAEMSSPIGEDSDYADDFSEIPPDENKELDNGYETDHDFPVHIHPPIVSDSEEEEEKQELHSTKNRSAILEEKYDEKKDQIALEKNLQQDNDTISLSSLNIIQHFIDLHNQSKKLTNHVRSLSFIGLTDSLNDKEQEKAALMISRIIGMVPSLKKVNLEYTSFSAPTLKCIIDSLLKKSEAAAALEVNLENSLPADLSSIKKDLVRLKRISKDELDIEKVHFDAESEKLIAPTETEFLVNSCKEYMNYLSKIITEEFRKRRKTGEVIEGSLSATQIANKLLQKEWVLKNYDKNEHRWEVAAKRYQLLEKLLKSTHGKIDSEEKIKEFEKKYREIKKEFPQAHLKDRNPEKEFFRSIGDSKALDRLKRFGHIVKAKTHKKHKKDYPTHHLGHFAKPKQQKLIKTENQVNTRIKQPKKT